MHHGIAGLAGFSPSLFVGSRCRRAQAPGSSLFLRKLTAAAALDRSSRQEAPKADRIQTPSLVYPRSSLRSRPSRKTPADLSFTSEVEEVLLHATVVDDKQRMVTNLDKDAFTILEDGKPQNITSFRHEDIPVAMGIVIDNSGSMREKRDKVNKAAINLVKSSNPQDEVFVVNFNDEYYLDQDFTADINKLREALGESGSARRNRSLRRGRGLGRSS